VISPKSRNYIAFTSRTVLPVTGHTEQARIYYIEVPDTLRVLRILHGRRNIRQILRQEKLGRE
jgi:hypothetical protein